jgi:DNA-directed RNA polymerase subunit M
MEFCPKCGAILVQKRKNNGCPRCSYSTKNKLKITTSEKINAKTEVPVISNKEEILPIVLEKCKKCKHEKAYFWTIQTRAGDESETKFFKCVKCGYTWRNYQ